MDEENHIVELFLKNKYNAFGHTFDIIKYSYISYEFIRYIFTCDCGVSTTCDLLKKEYNTFPYTIEEDGKLIEFNNRKFYYWFSGIYTHDEMIIKNIIE